MAKKIKTVAQATQRLVQIEWTVRDLNEEAAQITEWLREQELEIKTALTFAPVA